MLEFMQSKCAVDGKLISKVCKTIQIFPKTLNFCTENTPTPTDRLTYIVPHLATTSYFSC